MGKRFELTNATHINEVTVGGNDKEFEHMLDDFLERMSHVPRAHVCKMGLLGLKI